MPAWTYLLRRSPVLLENQNQQSSAVERGENSPPRRLSFGYFESLRKKSFDDGMDLTTFSDLSAQVLEANPQAIDCAAEINRQSDSEMVQVQEQELTCTHRQLRYLFFRPHDQRLCKRCQMLLYILAEERAVYDQLLSTIEQNRGGGASSALARQAYIEAKRIVSEEFHATANIDTRIKSGQVSNKRSDGVESERIVKRSLITLKRDRKGKMPLTTVGYSVKKDWTTMESNSNTTTTTARRKMHATFRVKKSTNRRKRPTHLLKETNIRAEMITNSLASETLPDVHRAGIKVRRLRKRESERLLHDTSIDSLSDDLEYPFAQKSTSKIKWRHTKRRRSSRLASV
ncbi:hypothetical protein POJ06DRAFT_237165 [Lipomyces tetrasporus]|uniref:Uncharacterized protein n=1 Tax=Lipomyces tetrasporus TaxID=54092 RepID=A0AAD7VTR7_9ASCO|nr:uncharacterized protein POJ06DRAFT_237165 [Lipomyces tetrasporus]KAJ8101004.1 hypothetical protein POJ06DRAFT_237165 [Lipomyces tetrasporus]